MSRFQSDYQCKCRACGDLFLSANKRNVTCWRCMCEALTRELAEARAEVEGLTVERDRYRAALTVLLQTRDSGCEHCPYDARCTGPECWAEDEARAALAPLKRSDDTST